MVNKSFNQKVLREVQDQLDGSMKVRLEGSSIVSDGTRISIVENGKSPKEVAKSIVASLKKKRKSDISAQKYFHI